MSFLMLFAALVALAAAAGVGYIIVIAMCVWFGGAAAVYDEEDYMDYPGLN